MAPNLGDVAQTNQAAHNQSYITKDTQNRAWCATLGGL